jgi:hydroxyquinol 1,2-dioxygenase
MHDINRNTITEAVIRSFAGLRTQRQKQLLSALVHHLHDFARETRLSHAEWAEAIEFLVRCGEISGAHRNEFMLLSDVLGVSSLVDMVDAPAGTTESSVLGPFYASDSPERPVGADLRSDKLGQSLLVRGAVQDMHGDPLPNALIDMWQTAENGLYATQDPDQPSDALRCNTSRPIP